MLDSLQGVRLLFQRGVEAVGIESQTPLEIHYLVNHKKDEKIKMSSVFAPPNLCLFKVMFFGFYHGKSPFFTTISGTMFF